jgi:hypothetical protein
MPLSGKNETMSCDATHDSDTVLVHPANCPS